MYSEKAGWLVGDSHLVVKKPSRNHGYSWPKAGELYKRWLACCLKGTSHAAVAKPADSVFTAPVPGVMQFILEVICSHCCRLVCGVDACACTSMWMSAFKYPLIQSDANTSGQRNRWLCVHPPNTSRNMCTYILIPSCVAEWRNTHAVTRKNIFLLRKSYVMLSFFAFHFLSFLGTNDNRLTQGVIFISYIHYPITFLHFFLSPILTHSLSSSISVSTWWVSSSVPLAPSLPPTFCPLCLPLPSSLCSKSNQVISQCRHTHTCTLCHAPAEEFASRLLLHSPLSSTDPHLSPLLLLLLALSLLLLLSSLLWLWVFFVKINPEKNICSIHRFALADEDMQMNYNLHSQSSNLDKPAAAPSSTSRC